MRPGCAAIPLLLAAVALACATSKAYPGPTLGLSRLAVVRGAIYASDVFSIAPRVVIYEIDGMERREDWRSGYEGDVQLLPGSYELSVQYQTDLQSRRSIRVEVESGYTYTVNFDIDDTGYFVVRSERRRPGAE